jgi:hypothetical protein
MLVIKSMILQIWEGPTGGHKHMAGEVISTIIFVLVSRALEKLMVQVQIINNSNFRYRILEFSKPNDNYPTVGCLCEQVELMNIQLLMNFLWRGYIIRLKIQCYIRQTLAAVQLKKTVEEEMNHIWTNS